MRNRIVWLLVFCGLSASALAQTSFDKYNFNFGVGPGIGRGFVSSFVGNSFQGSAGGGINFNHLFGVDGEYMYYSLGLRPSVSQDDGLPDSSNHLQSISVNGIVTVPRHIGKWGAYGIAGVGFDKRSVSLAHSYPLQSGSICQPPYYTWWGINCYGNNNPQSPPTVNGPQTLGSYSKDAGSYNFGGGVTYRMDSWHHAKLYLEYRRHKAYQSDAATVVWPVTFGLRW